MELNDILNIFYKNNSSKVQEFGRIYPKILYELSKKMLIRSIREVVIHVSNE